MNDKAKQSAIAWWNSITDEQREYLRKKYKMMFDIDATFNDIDIVRIWESQGWPDPEKPV